MIRIISHPAVLSFATVISIILGMPFGLGYSDFPYANLIAVVLLMAFSFSFPLAALSGCVNSYLPEFRPLRFCISLFALQIACLGLFHCLNWVPVSFTQSISKSA